MSQRIPQRLRKRARRRGQVPRSAVLTACGSLVAAVAALVVAGGGLLAFAGSVLRRGISLAVEPASLAMMGSAGSEGVLPALTGAIGSAAWSGGMLLLPLVAAVALGAVLVTLLQGPVWAPAAVKPDASRVALRAGDGEGRAIRAGLGALGTAVVAVVAVVAAVSWSSAGPSLTLSALWHRLAGAMGAPLLLALAFGAGAGTLELWLARRRVDRELAEAARRMPRSERDDESGSNRAVRAALTRLRR